MLCERQARSRACCNVAVPAAKLRLHWQRLGNGRAMLQSSVVGENVARMVVVAADRIDGRGRAATILI